MTRRQHLRRYYKIRTAERHQRPLRFNSHNRWILCTRRMAFDPGTATITYSWLEDGVLKWSIVRPVTSSGVDFVGDIYIGPIASMKQ